MPKAKEQKPAKAARTATREPKPLASDAPSSAANLGFEAEPWLTADKLGNTLDAAGCKHEVLVLIFLKCISDALEQRHAALKADKKAGAVPEDPDQYRAENIFWVPKEARWSHLQGRAKHATIGKLIDYAMVAIELDNPTRKVLPKDDARPALTQF